VKRRGKGKLWRAGSPPGDRAQRARSGKGEMAVRAFSIIEICMRGLEAPHDSPAEGRYSLIHNYVSFGRETSIHPICPRPGVSSFWKKVLFLCATQTLAVRDTEVQSTGRSLRMRTWVWAGALCMHEWARKWQGKASRVSHIALSQGWLIKPNTCSGRVWLALHLATPKSCLLSELLPLGRRNTWDFDLQVV